MTVLQNFSIPAGNVQDQVFTSPVDVTGDVRFRAYVQDFGCPDPEFAPLILKSTLSGDGVEILSGAKMVRVDFVQADTIGLLRNYYYEIDMVNGGSVVTLFFGIMTVTQSENRY